jgi:hypothetical protein
VNSVRGRQGGRESPTRVIVAGVQAADPLFMPEKQSGEMFGAFRTGRVIKPSPDGAPSRKARHTEPSPTRKIRRLIVRSLTRLDRATAHAELCQLAKLAHIDPPVTEAHLASFAGNLLAGGHFTSTELVAIHDALTAKVTKACQASGDFLGERTSLAS